MRHLASPVAIAAALLLAACAGAPPASAPGEAGASPAARPGQTGIPSRPGDGGAPSPASGAAPFTTLTARFTDRALKQERAGNPRRALDSWRVVAALRPQAAEPKRRVADLTLRLDAEADRRYREALVMLEEGQTTAARRELLLALVANPDHTAALEAIKNRVEPDAFPYTVAAGDSFEAIAKKFYGDAGKAVIVARINNLDPADKPNPGTVLTMPSLASPAAKPAPAPGPPPTQKTAEPQDSAYDTEPAALGAEEAVGTPIVTPPPAAPEAPNPAEEQLAKATELFQAAKFGEAAAVAGKLVGDTIVGVRARELAGNAWFAIGAAALKEDRFADATAAYKQAEQDRDDVPAALAAVDRRKKEKAEELYNAGVRFFINQKLDEAIGSWEQTLALNPEHPKAPRDIEKARGLQQKLKDIH